VRVGVCASRAQVHAAVAQVAQHRLDHAAAMLGREPVQRAAEGMGEVALVEHAVLVQRLDDDDVGRRQAGDGLEQRVELARRLDGVLLAYDWFSRCGGAMASERASAASSSSISTGFAT
jgi:hypothetical protein